MPTQVKRKTNVPSARSQRRNLDRAVRTGRATIIGGTKAHGLPKVDVHPHHTPSLDESLAAAKVAAEADGQDGQDGQPDLPDGAIPIDGEELQELRARVQLIREAAIEAQKQHLICQALERDLGAHVKATWNVDVLSGAPGTYHLDVQNGLLVPVPTPPPPPAAEGATGGAVDTAQGSEEVSVARFEGDPPAVDDDGDGDGDGDEDAPAESPAVEEAAEPAEAR